MLEGQRSVKSIGLELAAARIQHTLDANLIGRLADLASLAPDERRALDVLGAHHREVAAWAAELQSQQQPSAGW